MKINSITIIGGGSSGWMTSAAILKCLKHHNISVTLIESTSINKIGVGESTISDINVFLTHYLQLKDEDWMKECNATYKNSIRFTDFREKNTVFEYPFGGNQNSTPSGPMTWAELDRFNESWGPDKFAEIFSGNTYLAKYNRCTKNIDGKISNFNFDEDVAYHFDAELFGQFLKNKFCIPLGLQYFQDDIISYEKDSDGNLLSVVGKSGKKYISDLFIDCTGFSSSILEGQMGSEFISYNDYLQNDKAVATSIPYLNKKEQLLNVTNCTATDSGWIWYIPLWNRVGLGYVYSSKFSDYNQAENIFKNYIKSINPSVDVESIEYRRINIRHGRRRNAWVKNVIGIGLSYGFVEPLESTGLVSTHNNVIRLVDLLDSRKMNVNRFDIDTFNYAAEVELDMFKNFVSAHYALSHRNDTPYWKYVTEEISYRDATITDGKPRSLNSKTFFNYIESQMHILGTDGYFGPDNDGWNYILAGMGYNPLQTRWKRTLKKLSENNLSLQNKVDELEKNTDLLNKHFENTKSYIQTLPTTYEFLKQTIYKDE